MRKSSIPLPISTANTAIRKLQWNGEGSSEMTSFTISGSSDGRYKLAARGVSAGVYFNYNLP